MTTTSAELTAEGIAAQARWLRRLTLRLVTGEERAEEVAQETLLVALRHRGRTVRSVRAWLARVAANLARRLSREDHRRREVELATPMTVRGEPAADVVVARAEMHHALSAAVLSLDEPYRSAILLRYLDELSCVEIARRLDVPVETVRTRVKRGLQQLRRELQRGHGRNWAVPILGVTGFERLAACGAGTAAVGSILMVGSMGKWLAATSVALLVFFSWLLWPGAAGDDLPSRTANGATDELAATRTEDASRAEHRQPVPAEPVPAPATTGSLLVRVVYAEDGAPAEGISVRAVYRGDPDPLLNARFEHTGRDGIAKLTDLLPGDLKVDTDRDVKQVPAHITAGEQCELAFTLRSELVVEGLVVKGAGTGVAGAGIAGARILAASPISALLRRPHAVATTDTDGRFTLRAADPDLWLGAVAAGHAPSPLHGFGGRRTGTAHLRIVLEARGGAVRGRVEGPDGRAVEGAVLRFGGQSGRSDLITLPGGGQGLRPRPIEVRTAVDGTFLADGLAAGDTPVAARAKDLAPWSGTCTVTAGQETPLVVRMVRGFTCEGTATDRDGNPLAGIAIRCGEFESLERRQVRTDADGRYRFTGLAPGEVELVADRDAHGEQRAKVRGVEGETVVRDFAFGNESVLRGRVLDQDGKSVAGSWVGISSVADESGRMSLTTRLVTDREGRFRYPTCPEGGVTVMVMPPRQNHTQAHRSGVKPGADELVIRVTRFAPPTVRIRGRVVDSEGKPAGNATVFATRRQWHLTRPQPVDPETGAFALGPLPPDWHRLSIRAPGHAAHTTEERWLGANEVWDVGTVRLRRGGRAKVRIDRSRVGRAQVALRVLDAERRGLAGRRADGAVAYTGYVAPGRYDLVVFGKDIAAQSIPFEVREGEDTELSVTLHHGWRCELRIATAADRVRLAITGERGVVSDERIARRGEGALTSTCYLVPGRYTATVRTDDGASGRVEFRVEREAKTVDLPVR